MRKLNFISIIGAALLGLSNISFAQDTLVVEPGLGTLNAAILANGDAKIYKLQAGQWYGLDAIIEAGPELSGLQIIGEKTTGLPAVIQVGNAQDGSVFPSLFNLFTNLTLKNVFLADQDFSGTIGTVVMNFNAAIRVVVDNCVIDPAGINYTFGGGATGNHSKLFLTNSQILRNGYISSPNDGGWIQGQQFDTLWVENNTFVSSGQDFLARGFAQQPPNGFVWINHNTILWHDVWIKKSYNDPNFFFTNNLMVDPSIYAQLYAWGQFFPDYRLGNTMLSLTSIDTLQVDDGNGSLMNETLPSQRKMFWQRNLQYNSPQLKSLVSNAKTNYNQDIYLIPMLWDENTPTDYAGIPVVSPADSSRENRILNDHVNWPFMKYNYNMYDIDPQWVDARIAGMEDSVGTFINGWFQGNIFEPGSVDLNALPGYNWDIDSWNGVALGEYPQTWPRFNGVYTNPELLTASTEGLPLGDLNWYADKKALWEANKDMIMAHILALNEDQVSLSNTVVDIIAGSPDHETLEAAVIAAELDDDLSGDGPFTVFAPTDDAFAALPEGTLDALLADPTGALADILLYHVVSGKIMSTDLSDGQVATTLLGKDITVTINNDGVFINDAKVTVADIEADNGVVHVIDAVLIPSDATGIKPVKSGSILAYPNPSQNTITVRSESELKFVKVYDVAGTLMKSIEMQNSFTKNIDIADLNKGIYFLKAETKTGVIYTGKFVKN
jgi:uncharacterized surface protein with fasciclin (FAS1) repeats